MRNLKKARGKWLMMFISATFAVGMTSCNSDDDEISSETTRIWVVDTMVEDQRASYGDYCYSYEYSYDSLNRMTRNKWTSDSGKTGTYNAEYLVGKIVETEDYEYDHDRNPDRWIFTLKNGLISVEEYEYGGDVWLYTYNSNRELTHCEDRDCPEYYYRNYTWSNGLITSVYGVSGIPSPWYDWEYEFEYEYNRTISMSPSCVKFLNTYFLFGESYILFYDYLGKIPAYPIAGYYGDTGNATYTYSNIDDNGCPGKVTKTERQSVTTYTLTWKQL